MGTEYNQGLSLEQKMLICIVVLIILLVIILVLTGMNHHAITTNNATTNNATTQESSSNNDLMRLREYTKTEISIYRKADRFDDMSSLLFSDLLAHLLYHRQNQEDKLLDLFDRVLANDGDIVTQLLRQLIKQDTVLKKSEMTLVNEIMNSETNKIFECTMWLLYKRFDVTIASPELFRPEEREFLPQISKFRIPLVDPSEKFKYLDTPFILSEYKLPDRLTPSDIVAKRDALMRLREYTGEEISMYPSADRFDDIFRFLFLDLLDHLLYYRQNQEDTLSDLFGRVIAKNLDIVEGLLRHVIFGVLEPAQSEITLLNEIMNSETNEIFECTMWLIAMKFNVTIASPELMGTDDVVDFASQISKNRMPLTDPDEYFKVGRPTIIPEDVFPLEQSSGYAEIRRT